MEQKVNKYRLTDEVMEYYGRKLYRIQALKDFGDVHKGDLGGFIQSENNLSQAGNDWVYSDSYVLDSADIYGDACLCNNVYGDTIFTGVEAYTGVEK